MFPPLGLFLPVEGFLPSPWIVFTNSPPIGGTLVPAGSLSRCRSAGLTFAQTFFTFLSGLGPEKQNRGTALPPPG